LILLVTILKTTYKNNGIMGSNGFWARSNAMGPEDSNYARTCHGKIRTVDHLFPMQPYHSAHTIINHEGPFPLKISLPQRRLQKLHYSEKNIGDSCGSCFCISFYIFANVHSTFQYEFQKDDCHNHKSK